MMICDICTEEIIYRTDPDGDQDECCTIELSFGHHKGQFFGSNFPLMDICNDCCNGIDSDFMRHVFSFVPHKDIKEMKVSDEDRNVT